MNTAAHTVRAAMAELTSSGLGGSAPATASDAGILSGVLNALRVLEEVSARQPAGLSDLARRLGLPKSTVQRCLLTLAKAGWIRADRVTGQWELTGRAFSVGAQAANTRNLREIALPVLNDLQSATGETIHLMVPDGAEMVLIERLDSAHQLRTFNALGSRAPLHTSANGKAYLADLPVAEVDAYLSEHLTAATEYTLTDPAALSADLQTIRERGYATADQELAEGIIAVGAAIRPIHGPPVASLSISAPKVRVTHDLIAPYGHRAREAADRIAKHLPPGSTW
jgi:IclR family acetate operon transcriptional repressor